MDFVDLSGEANVFFPIQINASFACSEGYGVEHLLTRGFQAAPFVRGPVSIEITLPFPCDILALVIHTQSGNQITTTDSTSLWSVNTVAQVKAQVIAIQWQHQRSVVELAKSSHVLYTPFVDKEKLEKQVNGHVKESASWLSLPPRLAYRSQGIRSLTLTVMKMHDATGPFGLGKVEIWGRPSLKMCPPAVAASFWARVNAPKQDESQWVASNESLQQATKRPRDEEEPDQPTRVITTEPLKRSREFDPNSVRGTAVIRQKQYHQERDEEEELEYMDPITLMRMKIPVILPSGIRVDLSTSTLFQRHLNERQTDPFTGKPMQLSDCVMDDNLRKKLATTASKIKFQPFEGTGHRLSD